MVKVWAVIIKGYNINKMVLKIDSPQHVDVSGRALCVVGGRPVRGVYIYRGGVWGARRLPLQQDRTRISAKNVTLE